MMKTLRYFFVAVLAMVSFNAMAQTEVTINFDEDYATLFPMLDGVSSSAQGETPASTAGDFTGEVTSTAVDGVTITLTPAEGSKTPNRIWNTSPRLRLYSGTFTIKGENITKIVFDAGSNYNISAQTGALNDKTWLGEGNEVVFNVAKNTQFKKIVVTLGGEVVDPSTLIKELYREPLTAQGQFTVEDKVLPEEGLTYVWKFNNYGAVASAFANSTSYVTESWLISPIIDLTNATETSLEFTHAINKFSSIDAAKEQVSILVKINDGEWEALEGVTYPASMSWTFVENAIDVASKFDGKKVQVAFKYTSTAESAGTWEIKPFVIKGKGEATIIPTGIEAVKANAKFDGKMYNVAGQVVNKGYKGLVIMNGKKFIQK